MQSISLNSLATADSHNRSLLLRRLVPTAAVGSANTLRRRFSLAPFDLKSLVLSPFTSIVSASAGVVM